jgi:hypothetical protein
VNNNITVTELVDAASDSFRRMLEARVQGDNDLESLCADNVACAEILLNNRLIDQRAKVLCEFVMQMPRKDPKRADRAGVKERITAGAFRSLPGRGQCRCQCPHCKAEFWYTPGSDITPEAILKDHNRPDGRRCRKGAKS